MPGDYTVDSLMVSDAITLHGQAGMERPTITTGNVFGVFITDSATLRDLDFVHPVNSFGVSPNAGNPVIERITSTSTADGGMACTPYASSTWRDSVCWATGTNVAGMGTNGMPAAGNYQITLRNMTIVGESRGLEITASGTNFNVQVDAKNVIASSPGSDVRALATSNATVTITLENSNFADGFGDSGSGGTGTITQPGTGTNQTDAPVFVDAASGNFHQAPGSPTIDAGVADVANGATDFEGDPRAARGTTVACPERVDIGADELVTALECDPPETSIVSGPGSSTTDVTPSFGLSSDEAGTFECRVDDAAFAPCTSPYTPTALSLGAHTVQARAVDESGNEDETPATRSFTVVTPDTAFTKTPKNKVRTTKKRAKVTFAFTSTVGGSFQCSLDGPEFKPCTSPRTFKAKLGRHVFRVRSVSSEGVVDPTPAAYVFKVKRKVTR
jgi:hypothetical protein